MRSRGAPIRTSPGAYRAPDTSAGMATMRAEINTLTSRRVPRGLTELITLGRTLKRRARDIPAYFGPPTPAMAPPKSSTAAPNTYADLHSDSETSPTTSPEHSSKPADSDPNNTLNYEEPLCLDRMYPRSPMRWPGIHSSLTAWVHPRPLSS